MAQHEHDDHGSELSETQLRVRALETVLTEKGYIDPAALDLIIQAYETKIGPHTGARVVAKAWHDPTFKRALLDDGSKAVRALGHESRVGDHLVAVENTPARITSWFLRYALAIRGTCSGCPRSGTNPRLIARAR